MLDDGFRYAAGPRVGQLIDFEIYMTGSISIRNFITKTALIEKRTMGIFAVMGEIILIEVVRLASGYKPEDYIHGAKQLFLVTVDK